jgi:hypothetical protein
MFAPVSPAVPKLETLSTSLKKAQKRIPFVLQGCHFLFFEQDF